MLTDITLGQYFPGNSFLHRLDARTKLLGTLVYIILVFTADAPIAYGLLSGFALIASWISGVSFTVLVKSVKPLWIIILLTMAVHFFMTPGRQIFQYAFLTITEEGLRQGIFMALRLLLLIIMSSLLTLTTSPLVLTDGIERLLRPFKVVGLPAHELAMMMTIALRFIPTLLEETERIMKAQMSRGAEFDSGNLIKRAKNLVPLLVPLFVSAFRRADELATAMEARCYRGGDQRTRLKELQLTGRDWLGMVALLLFSGLILSLKLL